MSNYNTFGTLAFGGENDKEVGYWGLVVTGIRDETITFDPNAAGGKGQFKGAVNVIKATADAGNVMPQEFRGVISKACKVIQAVGAGLLVKGLSDERVVEAVKAFFTNADTGIVKSIPAYYAELFPTEKKETTATLAQMVANLYAWADKNEVDVSAVVAEVLAQGEAKNG